MDRQTSPAKIIHYSQRPEAPSVKQTIRHEIYTPKLIDMRQGRALLMVCRTDMPAGTFPAQIQPLLAVNPVCY